MELHIATAVMATATVTASYKIGANRGRSRIWMDGKRLLDAGFVGGSLYSLTVSKGLMTLTLAAQDGACQHRKVTGRPSGKPIIDITGATVDAAFSPMIQRVTVVFQYGTIIITAKED